MTGEEGEDISPELKPGCRSALAVLGQALSDCVGLEHAAELSELGFGSSATLLPSSPQSSTTKTLALGWSASECWTLGVETLLAFQEILS